MPRKKFIRRDYKRYSKIGKNRPKLQKWRKPKGRDNKMRLKRKSYPISPTIGRKRPAVSAGKISGLQPVLVRNTKDLENFSKKSAVLIARVGAKKKLEIIRKASELKLPIINVTENKK